VKLPTTSILLFLSVLREYVGPLKPFPVLNLVSREPSAFSLTIELVVIDSPDSLFTTVLDQATRIDPSACTVIAVILSNLISLVLNLVSREPSAFSLTIELVVIDSPDSLFTTVLDQAIRI
jgi:hypothetical protein